MQVAIIGAGIGGLTTALALQKAGIEVIVYEAAPAIKSVGAGIILAINALQVMRQLGLYEQIAQQGNRMDTMTIAKADFSPLTIVPLTRFSKQFGLQNYAIHRADLHALLAGAIGYEHICLNKRLKAIGRSGHGYALQFEDDSLVEAPFVIAADGIHSTIRQQLFAENRIRSAEQVCWRGLVAFSLPEHYRQDALEAWGKGIRFGMAAIGKGIVYWYLVVDAALDQPGIPLTDFVKDFHPLASSIIEASPKEKIFKSLLTDLLPVQEWNKERICLLGDAAHATTPNLGQGACQAIEDAYVLGELAKKYPLEEVFHLYPQIRRAKAHTIVRRSWTLGKAAHLTNPVAIGIRNAVFKYLTPSFIMMRQLSQLFSLDKVE
ncbi:FAD-dependent monooxygenase [Flavihumibacter sp. CACIAM 22H1]|uniref:FAD-dependent monooxygenase n=1 Tax=Flavihumibacter sp. CACIAM 22H1 TaxID=1812911 RepID=UPI0007A7E23F|nr:FAD-dependent monooxygenase [Flavihumibacter sp. CACIAM 22H1]KYP13643.1 MAG: hypothetical protein A1D16_17930 [Flavihumibacter sp. CACIAM 22H1]